MQLKILPQVCSTFGKGAPGSLGLSFAGSADAPGSNCSKRCPHYGTRCYAEGIERRYRTYAAKLERHAAQGIEATARAALDELKNAERGGFVPVWFRFNVSGSLPAHPTAGDVRALRALCAWLAEHGVPIHLPLETRQKATRWRRALRGLGVTVRESATSGERFRRAPGPVSFVAVGGGVPAAKAAAAKRRTASGRRCIVCPAVAAQKLRTTGRERAKCGNCTACADPSTDVVYPSH